MLYNPFRSGRNGRKISYRHANRYEAPLCSTSAKISACFGHFGLFRPFRPVSAGICNPAGILFCLLFYFFFLSFDLSASPPPAAASSFKLASSLQLQARLQLQAHLLLQASTGLLPWWSVEASSFTVHPQQFSMICTNIVTNNFLFTELEGRFFGHGTLEFGYGV